MSDELKPCKHCGGEARFQIFDTTCNVECRECGIGTRNVLLDNYQVCVYKWNRSADDAPINEKHVPSLKESTEDTQVLTDNREKLLDYIWREITTTLRNDGRLHDPYFWYANIESWLDRQAAITERELCGRCSPYATAKDYMDTIDSLTAERDQLKAKVDELNTSWRKANDGWAEANAEAERCRQERDRLQRVAKVQAESFKALEIELAKATNG